nr:MAG TPA: hypothetical protein [Caudoviricetes sp.]
MSITRSRGGYFLGIPPVKNLGRPISPGAGAPHLYAKCI